MSQQPSSAVNNPPTAATAGKRRRQRGEGGTEGGETAVGGDAFGLGPPANAFSEAFRSYVSDYALEGRRRKHARLDEGLDSEDEDDDDDSFPSSSDEEAVVTAPPPPKQERPPPRASRTLLNPPGAHSVERRSRSFEDCWGCRQAPFALGIHKGKRASVYQELQGLIDKLVAHVSRERLVEAVYTYYEAKIRYDVNDEGERYDKEGPWRKKDIDAHLFSHVTDAKFEAARQVDQLKNLSKFIAEGIYAGGEDLGEGEVDSRAIANLLKVNVALLRALNMKPGTNVFNNVHPAGGR